ncbi:MAG: reverse transcriptase domain-containing protein [Bacillota bacterium]
MMYEEVLGDANVLYRAYIASIKGSKWKESTQKFMLNYLRNIFEIQSELQNRTLTNGAVGEFYLSERGKTRPITSLSTKDRIVRHALCDEVLLPVIQKKIIYDNGASVKNRGVTHSRKRFETHLYRYYRQHGNDGYILFGDFSKFYDNVIHSIAKQQLLSLFQDDSYLEWLLDLIFDGFRMDVSYMTDDEYENCLHSLFDKIQYRSIPEKELTGEKYMDKSIHIGDQLAQVIGIYYPHQIDTYVKYVRSQKFYGRYMDDWYIISPSKEELTDLLYHICEISDSLGLHINTKKTRIAKLSDTYKYLQVKYTLTNTGKIVKRINPKRVTAMRRKLKKLGRKVKDGEVAYDNVENMFKGWMGSFYKLLSKQQRRNLLVLYEELFNKQISIQHKKLIVREAE